ncbi:MAG: hypothetical protein KDC85_02025 [Saprospiraceae bacterium]|nr:hypothetical protein [Saprospiraceae bacterium]MCB9325690.1 hypothetical protein [Lewinellaceae bacterium]
MNTNKILLAGLVGGVAAFLLGWLVWGILLSGFYANNAGPAAEAAMRGDKDMLWIPLILGNLAWGYFFAVIFGRWANISTFVTGAKAGAVLGLLVALFYDLMNLGTTYLMTTTGAIVDIIASALVSAIIGGVVGWMLGRNGGK